MKDPDIVDFNDYKSFYIIIKGVRLAFIVKKGKSNEEKK
tara:strand:- start:362 stop:478 length:117 start_codon:yes stop_codon:yes gene_type:complete